YVSMENKLLFESGSWAVGNQGKKAVQQLGGVLADNPDISILIEGHTDNVPYTGSGQLSGNWDLSTKRATAIVTILRDNPNIDPQNLTAAGRGEYAPIASNDTPEGRAKNRRIEVILTPKLDELTKLLDEL
ncbi:MAG: OmpA family protein, partial [Mangrovimonas sp.]|nr:OmpA family protein [Mangrovimonas sp.]